MKIQREKDALEAINALEAYVKDRLTDARMRAGVLAGELEKLRQFIKVMENRASSLQTSKLHWTLPLPFPEESAQSAPTPEDSLRAVISILESSQSKMRVRAIAIYAHEKGLITSSRGLSGVISNVNNIVSRHSPKIFTNCGWGWWDLTERQHKQTATSAPIPATSQPITSALETELVNNDEESTEETGGKEALH
jgi:hypothetical protein